MGGGGVEVRAGRQYLLELELVVGVEVLGTAQHPGSDLADLGYRRGGRWRGAKRAIRRKVGGYGAPAAPVALLSDLPVQGGGVGDAGVPPLVQVDLRSC
jgi:hypothetical protein